jgi:prepilin-type N-terminal cleavage/methylation domain-containing protein
MNSKKAFTLIELLVVVSIIALLIAILLPALGIARKTARKMTNSTQLRGTHQGMVNYAQGNKTATGDGFFPGLDNKGRVRDGTAAPVVVWTGASYAATGASGVLPEVRLAVELNSGFVTPEYLINPTDGGKAEIGAALTQAATGTGDKAVDAGETATNQTNFSYALLQISAAAGDSARTREWSERINGQAAMITDRNTGGAAAAAESVWTDKGSAEWEGTVVFNDNSAQFISRSDATTGKKLAKLEATRYADQNTQSEDDMFVDTDVAPATGTPLAGRNAAMVHKTGTDLTMQSPF